MKQIFRYATLFREPGPGAVPRDGLLCCGYTRDITPDGRLSWGWVDYNRELSPDEVSKYELEYIYCLNVAEGSKK